MEQRVTGGNYPAITAEDLKKIKIVLPKIKIQQKITHEIKLRYEKAKHLKQEAETAIIKAQEQVEHMIFV